MEEKQLPPRLTGGLPSGLKRTLQPAIEIRIWEIYLTRTRGDLQSALSMYALDKGGKTSLTEGEPRVIFRFTMHDWEKSIMPLLIARYVPFEIIGHFSVDVLSPPLKKRVFVAEDDLNILFALNTILEDAGYDVIVSHCGNAMMRRDLPAADLFILDKGMPDIDGIAVCQHLRAQQATREVPILMISAIRNFKEQAYKAGVNYCLEKPFQMKELLSLVARYTGNGGN
jgi:CheY-like chemotaxis protein